jgi:protocatechuate 3,4-dioxygenase beta subunit
MHDRRHPMTIPIRGVEAADIEIDSDRRRTLRRLGMASVLPVAASVIGAGWVSRAQAQQRLMPTPRQTEGPFYPVEIPADSDHDLLVNGSRTYTPAHRTKLTGSVVDVDGKPLKGAVVEIWQCDEKGHYHHPGDGGADPAFQGFGRANVDADGRYAFVTMRPARYTGRTPHIHVKVKLGRKELLTTQLYVAGDAGNERDGLWRRLNADGRAALTVPFVDEGDGWLGAKFGLVVEA